MQAGADFMVGKFKEKAKQVFTSKRTTGALADSIDKVKKNDFYEVYAQGKVKHKSKGKRKAKADKKPDINMAGLASILEYGKSNMPGNQWWSSTLEANKDEVFKTMEKVMTRDL